ncbi:MAG: LCP family protein [Ardenticatenaceae bacterium]|nr:LCP family protein [Ardenticatenaceae bacterium]
MNRSFSRCIGGLVLLTAVWLLIGCRPATVPILPTAAVTAVAQTATPTAPSNQQPISLPPTNTTQPTRQPDQPSQPTATLPPTFTPEPTATLAPTIRPFATLEATPPTAVPSPIPPFPKSEAITNIVLVGNDVAEPQGGRTDSIIIVSINRDTKTATMLSLPRDLYVVIPGWRMTKINLALPHGHGVDYPGAGGGLLKDTIEYNLGLPIDYYARIGFEGFKSVVDAVGGVEVVVTCALTDWRLKSPELDQTVEDNWELFTLEPGVYQMDGDLALWYARSRRTTNDFERGRRQQQVLRAIFDTGLEQNLITDLPDLWRVYREAVETDLTLPVVLELAALAPAVRENGVQHLAIAGDAVQSWLEPGTGWSTQLLRPETAVPILRQVMQPPALNRATRPPIVVEVVGGDEELYRLAAENLAWYGFIPRYVPTTESAPARTHIDYFGPNFKGSSSDLLSWLFHQTTAAITLQANHDGDAAYRIYLGYDFDPCLPSFTAPAGEN